jgi:hypothetical protein
MTLIRLTRSTIRYSSAELARLRSGSAFAHGPLRKFVPYLRTSQMPTSTRPFVKGTPNSSFNRDVPAAASLS